MAGDETTTLSTTLVCFPGQATVGIGEIIEEKLEAPPGFEPGVEVLQTSALPLGDGAPCGVGVVKVREILANLAVSSTDPRR